MRMALTVPVAALALASAAPLPARAQVYVTGILATFPDPNGKVPALNAVPGAGIQTWSNGLAQAVLLHGQTYNYCIAIASATADGHASVAFKIARGKTIIQSGTILTAKQFQVGPNGVWDFCAGFHTLPSSPGAATLTGTVVYKATGSN
jgi:hypothetical protein